MLLLIVCVVLAALLLGDLLKLLIGAVGQGARVAWAGRVGWEVVLLAVFVVAALRGD